MGSLGDNLLKLTEFPFSYSLISLLALINYGEGFLSQPIERLGPLLILMGFFATTLSIIDPIGRLQRDALVGFQPRHTIWGRVVGFISFIIYVIRNPGLRIRGEFIPPSEAEHVREMRRSLRRAVELILNMRVFREEYFFAVIPSNVLVSLSDNYQNILNKMTDYDIIRGDAQSAMERMVEELERKNYAVDEIRAVRDSIDEILSKILSQQANVVKTVWIGREIDKITSMIYFVIVVAIFISAVFLSENFMNHFLSVFQGNEQVRLIILVSSLIAIIILLIMIAVHIKGLLSKAVTTFRYLIELDAIKIENERFNPILKSIEQYLSNSDWTMAEYWTNRLMQDYNEVIKSKFVRIPHDGKISKEINYQDLGIY